MKTLVTFITILIISMYFSGCISTSIICQDDRPSIICELSREINLSPETLSGILLITNERLLAKNRCSARSADKFVNEIISDLEKIKAGTDSLSISYLQAIKHLEKKYKLLPYNIQTFFGIVSPMALNDYYINQPLTEKDIELLLTHLRKRKTMIEKYL